MEVNKKIENHLEKRDNKLLSRDRIQTSEDDHHMEFVEEVNGIAYINDARSIRLTATRNSLEVIEASIVLIVGGNDVGNDYSVITPQVKQKVVAIIYLGANSESVLKHFSKHSMLFAKAMNIKEAVQISNCFSRSGDVVLFSPACSGKELCDNYKNRGNEFKEVVKGLK